MNIYAERGSKVIVTEQSSKNGLDYDREKVAKHLEIGVVYTVKETDVGGWCTDVTLEEFPNLRFNSVNFVDYYEEEKELEEIRLDTIRDCVRWGLESEVFNEIKTFDVYKKGGEISFWSDSSARRLIYPNNLSAVEIDKVVEIFKTLGFNVE